MTEGTAVSERELHTARTAAAHLDTKMKAVLVAALVAMIAMYAAMGYALYSAFDLLL